MKVDFSDHNVWLNTSRNLLRYVLQNLQRLWLRLTDRAEISAHDLNIWVDHLTTLQMLSQISEEPLQSLQLRKELLTTSKPIPLSRHQEEQPTYQQKAFPVTSRNDLQDSFKLEKTTDQQSSHLKQ